MGATSATTAPARHVPPKNKGKVVSFSGRFVGDATGDAPALQAGDSSRGLTVANVAEGQYSITLPGKGGCQLGAIHATFEGASAKTVKVESRSESTRLVTFAVLDDALADADLAAAEYVNFTIYVLDV